MLELYKISKKYKNGNWGLHELSFKLPQGKITAVIGPNGSGKTTLVNLIFGNIPLTKGFVKYYDYNNTNILFKEKVVGVFDRIDLLELFSGREYLTFINSFYRKEQEACKCLIRLFQLEASLDQSISSYSHGMKKKVQIIAAILANSEVLVLDEPYRGLDVESIFILESIMKKYAMMNRSVLICTHELPMVDKITDHLIILKKGNVIENSQINQLQKKYNSDDIEGIFYKSLQLETRYDQIQDDIQNMFYCMSTMEEKDL